MPGYSGALTSKIPADRAIAASEARMRRQHEQADRDLAMERNAYQTRSAAEWNQAQEKYRRKKEEAAQRHQDFIEKLAERRQANAEANAAAREEDAQARIDTLAEGRRARDAVHQAEVGDAGLGGDLGPANFSLTSPLAPGAAPPRPEGGPPPVPADILRQPRPADVAPTEGPTDVTAPGTMPFQPPEAQAEPSRAVGASGLREVQQRHQAVRQQLEAELAQVQDDLENQTIEPADAVTRTRDIQRRARALGVGTLEDVERVRGHYAGAQAAAEAGAERLNLQGEMRDRSLTEATGLQRAIGEAQDLEQLNLLRARIFGSPDLSESHRKALEALANAREARMNAEAAHAERTRAAEGTAVEHERDRRLAIWRAANRWATEDEVLAKRHDIEREVKEERRAAAARAAGTARFGSEGPGEAQATQANRARFGRGAAPASSAPTAPPVNDAIREVASGMGVTPESLAVAIQRAGEEIRAGRPGRFVDYVRRRLGIDLTAQSSQQGVAGNAH